MISAPRRSRTGVRSYTRKSRTARSWISSSRELEYPPRAELSRPRRRRQNLNLKNGALAQTDSAPKPFTVNRDGFSLSCTVACQAHQRIRLDRLCRYITRPALCLERLSTM